ncbi:MAG: hypothetical protein ACHRXM_21585 [Isosphaerales bacterium]
MLYEREDWTLFRNLETLSQKAGVPLKKLPAVVAKELTDNALDAGAKCEVGLLEGNGFWVEDNGEGIDGTDEEIAELFSINRTLKSSKLVRLPTRGALGNGLRVVAGAVLGSGGSLVVQTKGRLLRLIPQEDDGSTIAEHVCDTSWLDTGWMDTRIEVRLGESLPVSDETLAWARQAIALAAGEPRYSGRTSPHWYDADAFYELLQADKQRTVREVVEEFEGCSGPKAGQIAADFKMRPASDLTRAEAEQLLTEARKNARPVKPERLGCLGPVIAGLPQSYAKLAGKYERKAARGEHDAEIPFVLEAYAEVTDQADCQVFVNRTPITGNIEAFHSKDTLYIIGCGLDHNFAIGRRPIRVFLNVETPHMPITSDGKAPDLGPFLREIYQVLETVARRAKKQVAGSPEAKGPTMKDIILEFLDESIAKASGSGEYRFSLRQLFYAVRPHVIEALQTELKYDYFGKVITDYEADKGEIEGMYYDPRGVVYHPHTGEEIQLGTLQVEEYERPAYTFNKVLYSEKEGLFQILKAAKWPERHDCALMTSKGFPNRAARDLIDLLGETDEELLVFCIHDADASGTMIYQALQEGTKARPGRKVRIINLGLEPAEALEMDLQVEEVPRENKRRQAVADYVDEVDADWLQDHRVELNAMTSPQLLEWLDLKMEDHGEKLVPPTEVLEEHLQRAVGTRLEQRFTEQAIREAKVPERVQMELAEREPIIRATMKTIQEDIRVGLVANPSDHWTAPVGNLAETIVGSGLAGSSAPV